MTTPETCAHVHTTGIHCPDPAGHDYDHGLPDGCTTCNFAEPEHDTDGYRQLLRDVFDAYGALPPDPRTLEALAQVVGAAYGWGWAAGHDDGQIYSSQLASGVPAVGDEL